MSTEKKIYMSTDYTGEAIAPHQQFVTGADGVARWEPRLAYAETEETVILPETTLLTVEGNFFHYLMQPFSADLAEGMVCTVNYNGTEYKCSVEKVDNGDGTSFLALGNIAAMKEEGNTGEPFVLMAVVPPELASQGVYAQLIPFDEAESVTISITGVVEKVKTIDPDKMGKNAGANKALVTDENGEAVWSDSLAGGAGGGGVVDAPVKSVNGKTGDVVLTAEDVGAMPADAQIVDADAREQIAALSEEIENKNGNVTPQMFGAKGDGATDDTDAIQAAINNGGTVYLPAGRYKITKTLFLRTGTTLLGTGDSSVIFLGDNGENLTPHDWYIGSSNYPQYRPYITTQDGARDISISRIRVEGNMSAYSPALHVGICVESAENVKIDYVTVYKINYFPDEAPPRPSGQWRTGWNVGVLRSSRVEIANCTVQFGGYECVRIGTEAHDVWVHDSLIEYGWRTGLQVIEGCSNVSVERCTINQDDFGKYDTNACITFHPSDNHIGGDFWIRACRLNARGLFNSDAGGGAINVVWNHISNLFVEDTIIDANSNGLPLIHLKGNTTIRGCTLTAGADTNAITTNIGDGREFAVLVEDSIITSTDASRPTFAMYCNSKFHRCKITSAKTCIYTVDEGEVGIYLQVSESELHASASGNAIQIINKSNVTSPDGKVAFDIFNNNLDGKIYIAQANKVIDRKCSITNNTIIAPSGQSCIQNDYSSTEFKLLTIRDNVMSGGSNAVKLWGAGLAVIEGNNMTGCNAGIDATNERNIIKDNFLPE